jgi:uncharacterized membrane protein YozB (DUF420 family)
MLHVVSTIVLILIGIGLYYRRQRSMHWKFMAAAFAIDVALVFYIELTRHAVETVATQVKPFIWFHALISVLVLVLYVALAVLGRKMLAGAPVAIAAGAGMSMPTDNSHLKHLHRNLGIAFCVLRGLNYVTALMM